MYLKSIEAVGFKSFAEKIKLDFGPGISAIIGPNGSGKSNVSDAVKWVLGEQSAKSLRSTQMTDVIFNGTENRRPASGMAEVTLTFDNSDGTLPIDFTEVIITRKIYRSGEGEYYINKSPCRLKDIRELFAGTGIGADGYSIVEQREVEFVIESKPEERRELIEEAAGISRYKFRKEESLRKLERVKQDLARINDMLALHEEQVKALESAARKARQHQKLKEELRRAELAFIINQIDEHRAKISARQDVLNPLVEKRERFVVDYNNMLAESEKVKEDLASIDKDIISRQEEISKTSSRMELADTRISQAEELIKGCLERIRLREEENVKAKEELKRLDELYSELSTQLSSLETAGLDVRSRYEESKKVYEEGVALLNDIKKEEEGILKDIISSIMPVLSEKNNIKVRYESDISHIESLIASTRKELNDSEISLNESIRLAEDKKSARLSYDGVITQLDENFSQIEKSFSDLSSRREDLRGRLEAMSREISVIEGELSAIKSFEESDPVLVAIKSIKSSGEFLNGSIRGPIGEIFEVGDRTQRDLLLKALGEKAVYMIAATVEDAQRAIDFLNKNQLCALSFVIERNLPYEIRSSELFGRLSSYVSFRSENDRRIVEYLLSGYATDDKGGINFADGTIIRGGARLPMVEGEVGNRRVSLESRIVSLRNEAGILTSEIEKVNLELEKLNAERESLLSELRVKKSEKDWLDKEISELEKLNQQKKDYLNTLNGEIELNTRRLDEIRNSLSAVENEILGIRSNEENLKKRLEEVRDRYSQKAPFVEEFKKNFQSVEEELFTLEPRIDAIKSKLKSIEEQKSLLQGTIEQNLKEIDSWQVEIRERHEKVKEEEFKALQDARELKERLTAELAGVFSKREEISKHLGNIEDSIRSLERTKEELSEEIHKVEMDIRAFTVGLESLLSRLKDEYETDENSARAVIADSLLDAEEMAKLKKRIEALGSVNLAAPEEYEALNKKYQFILTERNDLEKAKSDLEEIISKINKTTKEQLTDTFNKVRENFKQVFSQLFEGGQGDLVLTNPDNILESGVDIIARPPGKTTKCMSLSGGEKALTAIALLFSFFLVRPAPFCLLDEVDAPLDEANVERFLNLLETFAEKTQFLIITHNKRTMLRAGVIYGITMEEFGVSKALSIKMEDVSASMTA